MDNDIKHVHVGQAIDKRRNELGLSKSELGRKIGVPQQHINRILERETMETSRLIKVSEALDFNFFSLFCPKQHHISAHLAAVSLDGNANNLIGDAELAVQLSSEKKETENLRETIKLLKEQIESLNSQILRLDSNLKDIFRLHLRYFQKGSPLRTQPCSQAYQQRRELYKCTCGPDTGRLCDLGIEYSLNTHQRSGD